jgi:alkanesulfonate monooxygenase SsuD/methylene tetrahydromethanopterin reductase-like flavin-dependent oxidoreductase (luciferase family)
MRWDELEGPFREQLGGRFLVGDPDEVGERCQAFLALGLDGLTVNMPTDGHDVDAVAFAGEVISAAAGRAS